MQIHRSFRRQLAFVSLSAALLAGALCILGPQLGAHADPEDEEFESLIANPAAAAGSCGV